MENEFIKDDYEIIGVKGEKTIKSFDFSFNFLGEIRVLITEEGEYYNFYIINEIFKQEPLNCLEFQEPRTEENLKSFTELYAFLRATEKEIWFKYGNPEENKTLSFNIEVLES